jgi:hypothetical protein
MSEGLVALAARYVNLEREIMEVRNAMRQALANGEDSGAGVPPSRPPTSARPTAGSAPSGGAQARLERAAGIENAIVDLVRDKPMLPSAISRAMGAGLSSTKVRLRRLEARGRVQRGENGWIATATS